MAQYVVGVDFGGTHLRAALVNENGEIIERVKRKTMGHLGQDAVFDRIAQAVRDVADKMKEGDSLEGVGVIAPGPLDPFRGLVFYAPNLKWQNVPLTDELHQRLGCPVWAGNDANLAALAEHRYGAGKGLKNMIYMTVSTGIGGGVIINDEMLLGTNGQAAEVGHMQIMPEGPLCGCGNRGCVESVASGTNMARIAKERLQHGVESSLQEHEGEITAKEVVQAAANGDQMALELLQQAGSYIGMAVANLVHLFNPQRFIFGGGVSNAGDLLFDPIRRAAKRRTMPNYHGTFDIVAAELGDNVGLLGAAALAFSKAKAT